jgi:hypothetical protein
MSSSSCKLIDDDSSYGQKFKRSVLTIELVVFRHPKMPADEKWFNKKCKALAVTTRYVNSEMGEKPMQELAPAITDCLTSIDYVFRQAAKKFGANDIQFTRNVESDEAFLAKLHMEYDAKLAEIEKLKMLAMLGDLPQRLDLLGWESLTIKSDEIKTGDVIVLKSRVERKKDIGRQITHVALGLGNERVFHCSAETGGVIAKVDTLFKSYFQVSARASPLLRGKDPRAAFLVQPSPLSLTSPSFAPVPQTNSRRNSANNLPFGEMLPPPVIPAEGAAESADEPVQIIGSMSVSPSIHGVIPSVKKGFVFHSDRLWRIPPPMLASAQQQESDDELTSFSSGSAQTTPSDSEDEISSITSSPRILQSSELGEDVLGRARPSISLGAPFRASGDTLDIPRAFKPYSSRNTQNRHSADFGSSPIPRSIRISSSDEQLNSHLQSTLPSLSTSAPNPISILSMINAPGTLNQ